MPRKNLNNTPWREKRKLQAQHNSSARRLSQTNRQRFRRQKEATFKKANGLFVDALDTGRDRRIYILIMEKRKSGAWYATYNSHPDKDWVPTSEEVANHWPRPEKWDPSRFCESKEGPSCTPKTKSQGTDRFSNCPQFPKAFTLIIPQAPLLHL